MFRMALFEYSLLDTNYFKQWEVMFIAVSLMAKTPNEKQCKTFFRHEIRNINSFINLLKQWLSVIQTLVPYVLMFPAPYSNMTVIMKKKATEHAICEICKQQYMIR